MLCYVDFNLRLTYELGRRTLGFRVDCDLVGEYDVQFKDVDLDTSQYRTLLRTFENPGASIADISDAGVVLGKLLFPVGVREFFEEARVRLRGGTGLRVRMTAGSEARSTAGADVIRHLPWEYVRTSAESRPLVLDPQLSLVRSEAVHGVGRGPLPVRSELVVASLDAGRAAGHTRPQLAPELPDISGLGSRAVRTIAIRPPTKAALDTAIPLGRKVDIFHFSGHGTPAGLILEDPDEVGPALLTGDGLAPVLSDAGVLLAVLTACHSGESAFDTGGGGMAHALVRAGIPIVLAMQHKVDAASAKVFVDKFYRSLLGGMSVDEAVAEGRSLLSGGADYGRPVLFHRSSAGAFLTPPDPTVSPATSGDHREVISVAPGPRPTVQAPHAHMPIDHAPSVSAAAWSQVSVGPDTWRIEAGAAGPRLSRVPDRMAPLAVERGDGHLAVSPDGRAAVQWSSAGCTAAWVIHHDPHLLHLPRHALPSIGAATLLAATFVGANQVKLILSTAERTYQIRLDHSGFDLPRVLHEEPSLAAVYLDPTTPGTVDPSGRVREDALRRRVPRLAAVSALDAARSDGVSLVAAVGTAADGSPMMVASSSGDVLWESLAGPATGVVVERRFDEATPPRCIVTAAGTAVIVHEIT